MGVIMADEAQNLLDYIESAFAVMERPAPEVDDKMDVRKALAMCIHWSVIGNVASLQEWSDTLKPPEPFPWPSGTRYPTG